MDKKIGFIGGDLRVIRLIEILSKEQEIIYTFKLEKYNFSKNNILKCKSINEILDKCNYIIGGIPFSRDGVYINTPFSNENLLIEDLLEKLQNKTLIAGAISKNIKDKCLEKNIKLIDLMEYEELAILNVIPTVEGAIQIAMEQTEFTINNSKCLVLGYGRIGKVLTKTLKALGAKVSCMARKESDIAWIKIFGYNAINIEKLKQDLQNEYDIIFNTIPAVILNKEKLKVMKNKNTIFIELASKPGGIDLELAKEYNIKVINAQGLPGKVAPLTAAKYIKQIIDKL